MTPARAALMPLSALASPTVPSSPIMTPRLIPIVIAVACAHGLALWALQSGLLRQAPKMTDPVIMVASLIAPPQPEATPLPQASPPSPDPEPLVQRPAPQKPRLAPPPTPAPAPKPTAEPTPTPPTKTLTAATGTNPQPPAETATAQAETSPLRAPSASPALPSLPAAPAKVDVEPPSSDAKHLNNPPPPYPSMSKRMGEQGTVVIRAFIEANGTASQASVKTSSGYERLDQTALETVLRWRYVPGKRAGVPEGAWVNIPLKFGLN